MREGVEEEDILKAFPCNPIPYDVFLPGESLGEFHIEPPYGPL
ncbi:hypothetical protein [Methanolobus sp.]|nr:hypothetical protein [Methanolobus sp.]